MIVPDRVQVEKIEELAQEVMRFSRDTLAVKLRFLNSSLSRLELLPSTGRPRIRSRYLGA